MELNDINNSKCKWSKHSQLMARFTRFAKNSTIICCLKENHFRYIDTEVKSKVMEKVVTSEFF